MKKPEWLVMILLQVGSGEVDVMMVVLVLLDSSKFSTRFGRVQLRSTSSFKS